MAILRAVRCLPLVLALARIAAGVPDEAPQVTFNGKLQFEATVPCMVAWRASEQTLKEWFSQASLTVSDPCGFPQLRHLSAATEKPKQVRWDMNFQVIIDEPNYEKQDDLVSHYSALNARKYFTSSVRARLEINLYNEYKKAGDGGDLEFYRFIDVKLAAPRVGEYVTVPGSIRVTAEGYTCTEVEEAVRHTLVDRCGVHADDVRVTVACVNGHPGDTWSAVFELEVPVDKVRPMVAASWRSYWLDGVFFALKRHLLDAKEHDEEEEGELGAYCCLSLSMSDPTPPLSPEHGVDPEREDDEELAGDASYTNEFGVAAVAALVAVLLLAVAYSFFGREAPATPAPPAKKSISSGDVELVTQVSIHNLR